MQAQYPPQVSGKWSSAITHHCQTDQNGSCYCYCHGYSLIVIASWLLTLRRLYMHWYSRWSILIPRLSVRFPWKFPELSRNFEKIYNSIIHNNTFIKLLSHQTITVSCCKELFVFGKVRLDFCLLTRNPLPRRTMVHKMISSSHKLAKHNK